VPCQIVLEHFLSVFSEGFLAAHVPMLDGDRIGRQLRFDARLDVTHHEARGPGGADVAEHQPSRNRVNGYSNDDRILARRDVLLDDEFVAAAARPSDADASLRDVHLRRHSEVTA
jgi:hypothetical protein